MKKIKKTYNYDHHDEKVLWATLLEELNDIDPVHSFVNAGDVTEGIHRTNDDGVYYKITRECIYSNYWTRNSSATYALRLYTSSYSWRASKYRKDFSQGVARKLYKKGSLLYDVLLKKRAQEKQLELELKTFKELVISKIPNATKINVGGGLGCPNAYIQVGNIALRAVDAEVFTIQSITGTFTRDTLKPLLMWGILEEAIERG